MTENITDLTKKKIRNKKIIQVVDNLDDIKELYDNIMKSKSPCLLTSEQFMAIKTSHVFTDILMSKNEEILKIDIDGKVVIIK